MTLPKNPKDIKALREFFTAQRLQVCGLADNLEEPWKTHFKQLKEDYDNVLAGLPPTDQAPAAIEANHHLQAFASLLCGSQALCSLLGSHVNSLRSQNAAAFNSALEAEIQKQLKEGKIVLAADVDGKVNTAVEAAIADRTAKGELVQKAEVTKLCSAAKDTGLAEGRAGLEAELKTKAELAAKVETRKTALQTAGLPIPATDLEKILGGTDEEFTALQTKAQGRIEGIKKQGIAFNAANALWAKVYLPDKEFADFEALLKDIPALRSNATPPEPLAGPGSGSKADNIVPMGVY